MQQSSRSGIGLPTLVRNQHRFCSCDLRHFSWHISSLLVISLVQLLSHHVRPAQSAALFASRRGNNSFITNNITDALIHLARDVNDSSVVSTLEEIDSAAVSSLLLRGEEDEDEEENVIHSKKDETAGRWLTGPWGSVSFISALRRRSPQSSSKHKSKV